MVSSPRSPDATLAPQPVTSRRSLERLEAQLVAMREQLRQTRQLASLGTAAAMLAHEFNNLMTPVVAYTQYALDHPEPEVTTKALEMTVRQTGIISSMCDRILGLASEEPQAFSSVPVRQIVDDALACLCRDLTKDRINLKIDVGDPVRVRADAKQLQQVFFNLLLNSRRALQNKGGQITIRAETISEDRVRILVSDNGCGMSPVQASTIFEPFSTSKPEDESRTHRLSGLGLTICRNIMLEHEGSIEVSSKPGKGTTFILELPAAP